MPLNSHDQARPDEVGWELAWRQLRRSPDVEAPNLYAHDASDRLILEHAAAAGLPPGNEIAVINDHYGALTTALATSGAAGLRVHQDLLTAEFALGANAERLAVADRYRNLPLGAELLSGARVVLVQLPKSLGELRELAEAIDRAAPDDVTVYLGGRVKHMTRSMNEVLLESFTEVTATLAAHKSRVLVARGPRRNPAAATYPVTARLAELDLTVCAHGAAFAGPALDLGTRQLLTHLDAMKPDAGDAVDLGCGTGIIAAVLARARPGLAVVATDQSAAAIASTDATLRANGLQAGLRRDNAMSSLADASIDLVVCNPPFHIGTSVHAGLATGLFEAAARVLRPGGELWTVYNSHLRYRPMLTRLIGPTRQVSRDPKFTVTATVKR